MLKSIGKILRTFLDFLIPPRTNFEIVKKLTEKDIIELPRASIPNDMPWIQPIFKYQEKKVKAIIWELKYRNNTTILEIIGKIMFDEILSTISDVSTFNSDTQFVLIPIPITNHKRQERGYNQSEYIARSIIENDANHLLLYAPQWLSKVKDTPSQSHSETRVERIKNLIGSFEANSQVVDKCIILIDDVVTTGSTLSEAKKELTFKGAREVFAFTIAH